MYAIGLALVTIGSLQQFGVAWRTAQWNDVFLNDFPFQIALPAINSVLGAVGPILVGTLPFAPRQFAQMALDIRAAALAGDERRAPSLSHLPQYAPAEAGVALPARFGPLTRPNDWRLFSGYLLGGALILVSLCGGVIIWSSAATQPVWLAPEFVVLVTLTAVFLIAGLLIVYAMLRTRRRILVEADALGLRWAALRWPDRKRFLVWGEIEAIAAITHHKKDWLGFPSDEHLFVMFGSNVTLAYAISGVEPEADARRLLRLALARTGLPVRDVTPVMQSLLTSQPAKAQSIESSTPTVAQGARQGQRSIRRQLTFAGLALLPCLLLPSLLYGAGLLAQRYQTHEYSALLAQVRARTPLYAARLDAPTPGWPVYTPQGNETRDYSFHDGAYWLRQTSTAEDAPYPYALVPIGAYRDVAIEVTARVFGDPKRFRSFSIVLRDNQSSRSNLQFFTDSLSHTWFISFDRPGQSGSASDEFKPGSKWGYAATSYALQDDPGAANRFSFILRNDQIIMYINSQFVGIYTDPAPILGYMYIGAEGVAPASVSIALSDFAVYPV